jgi:hypothetical protein
LAQIVWPAPDMREYQDLDVLADPRRAEEAFGALLEAGFALVDRNWVALDGTGRAEIAMTGPTGTAVDLHWHVVVAPQARSRFSLDPVELLSRARPGNVGNGLDVLTLDPVDTVHHLILHAGLGGANRLMWLADVYYATQMPGFDWAELDARTRRAGSRLMAEVVLQRVWSVLGSGRPLEWVRTGPGGNAWSRIVASRDSRIRFPGLEGDRHLGGALYSGTRATWWGSVVGSLSDGLRVRRFERRGDAGDYEVSVLDEDVPDAAARKRYFDQMASIGTGSEP